MKKARLTLSAGAFLFGLLVVFISLISTNQVISYEGAQSSQRKFYIGETILPDHVAYPLIAVADRLLLIAMPSTEKIKLRLTYAQIRMEYAQALLQKEELHLANIALTKSQKYVGLAAFQYLESEQNDADLAQMIVDKLEENIYQSQEIIKQLSPCQTTMAQQLNNQNQALLDSIK